MGSSAVDCFSDVEKGMLYELHILLRTNRDRGKGEFRCRYDDCKNNGESTKRYRDVTKINTHMANCHEWEVLYPKLSTHVPPMLKDWRKYYVQWIKDLPDSGASNVTEDVVKKKGLPAKRARQSVRYVDQKPSKTARPSVESLIDILEVRCLALMQTVKDMQTDLETVRGLLLDDIGSLLQADTETVPQMRGCRKSARHVMVGQQPEKPCGGRAANIKSDFGQGTWMGRHHFGWADTNLDMPSTAWQTSCAAAGKYPFDIGKYPLTDSFAAGKDAKKSFYGHFDAGQKDPFGGNQSSFDAGNENAGDDVKNAGDNVKNDVAWDDEKNAGDGVKNDEKDAWDDEKNAGDGVKNDEKDTGDDEKDAGDDDVADNNIVKNVATPVWSHVYDDEKLLDAVDIADTVGDAVDIAVDTIDTVAVDIVDTVGIVDTVSIVAVHTVEDVTEEDTTVVLHAQDVQILDVPAWKDALISFLRERTVQIRLVRGAILFIPTNVNMLYDNACCMNTACFHALSELQMSMRESSKKKICFFDPLVFAGTPASFKNVWAKVVSGGLESVDMFCMPIVYWNHWTLLVTFWVTGSNNSRELQVYHLDSLASSQDRLAAYRRHVKSFLKEHEESYKIVTRVWERPRVPKQPVGSSLSGWFTLFYSFLIYELTDNNQLRQHVEKSTYEQFLSFKEDTLRKLHTALIRGARSAKGTSLN